MFIACSKKTTIALTANSKHTANLKVGEELSFGFNKELFNVRFEKLSDSRCPTNARCIRAGDAVVDLTYQDAEQTKGNATLVIGESSDFNPDTVELKINKETYRIILDSVLPHPEIGKDTLKTATLHFYKL
ncbi:MAG: hypothetical protein EOO92_27500 [Pedobacter sp.]|nr:MAG: hypothetical protein EOO92_27500 [Pedobacter sp.]